MNNNYNNNTILAGVDEAGRGPLAGPVIAAAVILDPANPIQGLADSKKLSAKQRDVLYEHILFHARAVAVGRAEVEEIDTINILQASLLAMKRAVLALALKPDHVLVDGNQVLSIPIPCEAIVGGDNLIEAISAASIIAKVVRDREMLAFDAAFPGYSFAQHKGYGTAIHMKALNTLGPCAIHRCSFAPVRAAALNTRPLEETSA